MKPTRRGFLGGLLGVPAAAPVVLDQLTVGRPAPTDFGVGGQQIYWSNKPTEGPEGWSLTKQIESLKGELAWTLDNVDPVFKWMRRVGRIDPDIAANKLALHAKLRMQAERNRDEYLNERRSFFSGRIKDVMEQMK